ncbi:hypothetical protein L1887_18046 [Cichorium endivia]|nr:hypothetical protein L1887_18046 [Cichorium endivia]
MTVAWLPAAEPEILLDESAITVRRNPPKQYMTKKSHQEQWKSLKENTEDGGCRSRIRRMNSSDYEIAAAAVDGDGEEKETLDSGLLREEDEHRRRLGF